VIPALILLVPLLSAATIALLPSSPRLLAILPAAALPAFLYSFFGNTVEAATLPWLLLETRLGLHYSGPAFLFFTSALWLISGCFAWAQMRGKRAMRRFSVFWLLALCGNLGLTISGDVATFYTCFALMTFSAYGLVAHAETPEAWRAGRIYVTMAVAAETMLLAGLLLAVSAAGSLHLQEIPKAIATAPDRSLIIALLVVGFGVKAGVLPFHFWLPLAHPIAPTAASAVLSGAMIKAGLLGWMLLLPGGHGDFEAWSICLVVLGLATAFYGVACGLAQSDMKTTLAYSSISQMGVMLLIIGTGLAQASAWPVALAAAAVYALNHGFSKAALFLGAGLCSESTDLGAAKRRWFLAGLALPALAISGAPLMGGAVAKYAVAASAVQASPVVASWLQILLPLSAIGTAMLLGRFLVLANRQLLSRASFASAPSPRAGVATWGVAILGSVLVLPLSLPWLALGLPTAQPGVSGFWGSLWPILAGAALLAGLLARGRRSPLRIAIPPGDLVAPLGRLGRHLKQSWERLGHSERWRINFVPAIERATRSPKVQSFFEQSDISLRRREATAFFILSLLALLWLLLLL
jgi:formate hydrogenlyase subunit 3/multisubunit Na+/H+ antiporter MnhD subunit